MKTVDCHGKTVDEFELIIDRLSYTEELAQVITGRGNGVLRGKIFELQKMYRYTLREVAPNKFVLDFSSEAEC
jgi:hypothetical protein